MTPPIHCAHDRLADIATLVPHPRNPNTHSDAQLNLLAKIIAHQGWRSPIVVSKRSGFIVAGHGRLSAAQRLGLETVPVNDQDFANEADEWAHIVADNRIAELAEMDGDLLKGLLLDIKATDLDLDLTGFDAASLGEALDFGNIQTEVDAEPQIDKAAELAKKWGVETGQVWELGAHRILCGDSTKRSDVDLVMDGCLAEMCFTDPPYNVAVNVGSVEDLKARNRRTDGLKVTNDSMSHGEFKKFLLSVFSEMANALRDGGAAYICHAEALGMDVIFRTAFAESGFKPAEIIIWVKDVFAFGRQDYHWRHEPIIYGWKEGAAHYFCDDRTQDTVWEFPRPKTSELHPTMKPVEIPAKAISNSSKAGHIIYEPFSGSGTTIIACEQLGRKCRAVEIDPGYVAVAIQRWADATGGTPKLIK